MIDKWESLKNLIDADLSWPVHYSFERPVERDKLYRVKKWMEELEERETKEKNSNTIDDDNNIEGLA